eukprot:SM000226S07423  [mRNA]  locus=s226:211873:213228:- [translate_table: standard]
MAMDRKSREKEMASSLLSALYPEVIASEEVSKGFSLLLHAVDDLELDIPNAATELSFFLARAVVDDILAPLFLSELGEAAEDGSTGQEVVRSAQRMLGARHAGERILRCWGGSTGSSLDDAKDKIGKLLDELEAGGEIEEACQCIRDLDMPFFHHEVVKKALIMAMERQNERPLSLLRTCSQDGLITTSQMIKGFARVSELIKDIALDIPDARERLAATADKAHTENWLASAEV